MNTIEDFPSDKIKGEELRRYAAGQSNERSASVLIRPRIPYQQVKVRKEPSDRLGGGRVTGLIPESSVEQRERERMTHALREFLSQTLGVEPHYLVSARVFVADVQPAQLRELTRSPLIANISSNRRLS